jgi:hypothetical protein
VEELKMVGGVRIDTGPSRVQEEHKTSFSLDPGAGPGLGLDPGARPGFSLDPAAGEGTGDGPQGGAVWGVVITILVIVVMGIGILARPAG